MDKLIVIMILGNLFAMVGVAVGCLVGQQIYFRYCDWKESKITALTGRKG